MQRVIAGRGMEDSLGVLLDCCKYSSVVSVCYKGNGVSAVYINGRVCTVPLPMRNSRKKEI